MYIVRLLLFQKQYKKAFISCLYFLLGMFLPISIACLYLIFHHALKDFINVYFIVNMTSYSEEVGNIFVRLYKIYKGFISFCFSSGVLEVVLVLLFPIYLFCICFQYWVYYGV